jgi:ABC-2 type transport system ATP-binding protein
MRYGTRDVLHEVTFQAHSGEVLALLGPNGAGKTTTMEVLEGFRMRSAGTVSVLGLDPAHGDEAWRARIGVVPQSWRDHSRWRVRELLSQLGSYSRSIGWDWACARRCCPAMPPSWSSGDRGGTGKHWASWSPGR